MFTINNVLRANSLSCVVFGTLFCIFPNNIVLFLSERAPLPGYILLILGIGLIANGVLLFRSSKSPKLFEVYFYSVGDFLWVLFTLILISFNYGITTYKGIVLSSLVAITVFIFGFLQIFFRGQIATLRK